LTRDEYIVSFIKSIDEGIDVPLIGMVIADETFSPNCHEGFAPLITSQPKTPGVRCINIALLPASETPSVHRSSDVELERYQGS
jgi:hypothetical protein